MFDIDPIIAATIEFGADARNLEGTIIGLGPA